MVFMKMKRVGKQIQCFINNKASGSSEVSENTPLSSHSTPTVKHVRSCPLQNYSLYCFGGNLWKANY